MLTKRLARVLDERTGSSGWLRSALNHAFPSHWSFLLGEVALYSFVVLVATGAFLTFFYEPSLGETVYHGDYDALRGVAMSEAYASVVELSWDVRLGLLMRQTHHWAANVFLAAIVAHLCRNFFTGSYRRPRELNWMVGVTLLLAALTNGFAGYTLVDDLLSGTGLRVAWSITMSVPLVGQWLTALLWGGSFASNAIIPRLYVAHVLLLPALIAVLLSAHLALVWRQNHTQLPGRGRTDGNVIGPRLWPGYAAKSVGLLLIVAAALVALGGLFQINPVWLWGPFDPAAVTAAAQPDWYMGWIEGAMRLAGPWRVPIGGWRIPSLFWPAVLLPAVTFALLYAWPFVDRRVTGDHRPHHVLERPRDRPGRTALGAAVLAFYVVLLLGGSQDIMAQKLNVAIDVVRNALRVLAVVAPVATGAIAYKICRDLAAGSGPSPIEPEAPTTPGAVDADVTAGGTVDGPSSSPESTTPRR